MGLNLGPSYGAGGYADALKDIIAQREMARRTAIMEQESQQRGARDQIDSQQIARKTAIENALMNDGMPAQDIPYGQAEGPGGGPELVNVEDPAARAQMGLPAAPNIQASNRFRATEIPGVAGSGPGKFRAKTAQEVAQANAQAALDKEMNTGVTLNPNQVRSLGGQVVGRGEPVPEQPSWSIQDKILNGKPATVRVDAKSGRVEPIEGVTPIPRATASGGGGFGGGGSPLSGFTAPDPTRPSPEIGNKQYPGTTLTHNLVYQAGMDWAITGKIPTQGMGSGGAAGANRLGPRPTRSTT
jgi:hypothetical protein